VLPLHNWIKCSEGDITFCRVDSQEGSEQKDHEVWEMIYDDYIDKNGLNKMYEKMLSTMIKKASAELEYCITGDRFKLTEAEIQETKLETMLSNKGSGMTISQTLIHLSKWIGHWLNTKSISTQEYFNLLSEFEKQNKPQSNG
jgi:23S rRNA G2445 N2-methylase RlmL